MKTTLNYEELKELDACSDGIATFYDAHGDKTVTLSEGFKSNGWGDFWWYISEIKDQLSSEQHRDLRLLACDYAESVLGLFEKEYPDDDRPRKAIEVSRLYAHGNVSKKQLDAARDAASDAAWDAWDAWDARDARDAAMDAAWAACDTWAACAARAACDAAPAMAAPAMAAWTAAKEKLLELLIKWEGKKEG
jgi:hypothetical protein